MSFIYKDNIYYKICEAIFIGISAGYWFITYFWDSLYRKAWVGIYPSRATMCSWAVSFSV